LAAERAYLDHNATTPPWPAVTAAVARALELGNPSSVHAEGRAARAAVEAARGEVARLLGARRQDVVFTSGGTEAAALLLSPGLGLPRAVAADERRLLVGAGEHACVLAGGRFLRERIVPVPLLADGLVDLAALAERLAAHAGALVAVQAANNETGVIQPIADIAALCQRHGALLVVDAVQAAGKLAVDGVLAEGAAAVFISGHKLGGPKGIGALAFAPSLAAAVPPLQAGGGQERGYRAGTENVAGIVGLGQAALLAADHAQAMADTRPLRDALERRLMRLGATIFGTAAPRLPNTSCFALPGLTADKLLITLDLAGFAVSSGSACSSGKVRRSHVLAAMGVPDGTAEGAIRVSLGRGNSMAEVERLAAALERLAAGTAAKAA
jgi:cysteine desulfurase